MHYCIFQLAFGVVDNDDQFAVKRSRSIIQKFGESNHAHLIDIIKKCLDE